MPSYSISAPDGNTYTITGPEGASREEVIQEVLSQNPSAGTARTFGGYAKEAVKGLGRGAVGFLESAGIGAAALLPEEVEKPVAAKIKELGDRFSPQAAPGYEDAIPTRLGEGLGSMLSTLAIPGGVIGRGLALGASGAGEARQRAQQEKATPEQISTATAQGIAPGLVDLLPIQFLLGGAGKVALTGLVSRGVRAATTGSVEGVTEAAQNIMQNAIAQGYKPEQGLYEGAGEAASYGGAVGAIAQGLMDLALPGRARRGQQPQREAAQTPPVVPEPAVQEPVAPEIQEPPLTEPQLAAETPQAEPVKAAEAAAPVVAATLRTGVGAPPKQSSWKEFIGTNPDKAALEARLEEVNGRLAWEEVQPKRDQFRINGLKKQRDEKIPNALAAVAAPGVAPQVDVTTLLKSKKVAPDEPIKIAGAESDGSGTSDAQLVPSDKSKEPGIKTTDVAGVGGTEQPAGGLTGGEKVLPDALKVPYKEVSVKDEETSVKVFNEYKQNQKGTTTSGTLDLTDPTIRASQTAVTPARVEAFAKNADLSETLARLDKKEPILVVQVGGKNVIVDGHHRVTAAKLTGLKEVPVHFLEADVKGKINKAKLEKKVLPDALTKEYEPLKDQKEVEYYFTGKRGSIYAHHADGTTTAFREPSDMAGTGAKLQDRSVKTIYVQDPRVIAPTNAKTELRPSNKGKVARFFTEDYGPRKAGEMVPGTETSFTTTPSVGSSPVEAFKNGFVHFGSPITAVTPVEKAAADKAKAEQQAAADKAAAPVEGKINKAKLEKKVTPEPVKKTEVVAEGTPDPERLKRAAEYKLLKDALKTAPTAARKTALEAAIDYHAHYGSIDESIKNLGFDLAYKTKKGEMGYTKEGGAPAQHFADWVKKSGTPEQKVTLKKSQKEYAALKEKTEDAVFVQRGVKQRDLEEAVREQLERENKQRRLAAEKEFKQEKKEETETIEDADVEAKFTAKIEETKEEAVAKRGVRKTKEVAPANVSTVADRNRIIKEAEETEPEFSRGEAAASTGNTKEDVTKALKNHFKEDSRFDALTTVVQSEKDLPDEIRNSKDYRAGTRGVAYKNKVFLVADNIQRGRELGVFLHEAGAHIGFDNVLKPSDRQFLADQVRKWAKGKGDAVETVAAKVALEKGGKNNDEIIAYMTEELVNRGVKPTSFRPANTWLRRVVEAFKKVMTKLGLRQDIAPQELVDLAYGAANIAMDTKVGQELAEFKRIATEVFDEPRFERGKATDWYRALGPHNETYQHDYYGETKRYWETAKLRIGSFGPVNNAAIRIVGLSTPSYSEIELVVYDENIHSPVNGDVVEKFYIGYYPKSNQLEIGTLGVPPESIKVQQKYFDYLNTESGYIKFNSGIVGNITTRTAIRTLRDKALELGYINENTTLHFNRATGATAKNFPEPKTLNYDQIMRFSQANLVYVRNAITTAFGFVQRASEQSEVDFISDAGLAAERGKTSVAGEYSDRALEAFTGYVNKAKKAASEFPEAQEVFARLDASIAAATSALQKAKAEPTKANTKKAADALRSLNAATESVPKSYNSKRGLSPAFKKWFGDSKVVDANGEPQVVYHGTASTTPINVFEKKGGGNEGYWFGESSLASDYATRRGIESAAVYPVYLHINRPTQDLSKWNASVESKDGKYDGYIGKQPDGRSVYSVLSPNQIESVFNENPTSNPDIRFSQANPGMDAVDARTLGLVSGPSAPQSIVQRAYQTALNPRPEKFMQNLRQNSANKNTWWEDWFSSLHGNNALDTAGAASAIDRVQASTKIGGIQLSTLEKGGFRKGANGLWEAYDTDASYKDIVEQVSKMEGKYRATPDFDSAQTMFNLAATAKREEGLMASGQTTDTGGGIKRTLDDAQLRQGLAVFNSTPEIREALRLYKKFNDRNVDTLITAGIIDSSLAAELKGNSGYVPWFRFMQDANGNISTKAVKDFSRGLINLSKMQDLEGGKIEDVQIGNILDNMAKLSNWMVGKSIGNDTSAFMVDFAIPYGQAKRVGLPTAGGVDAKKTIQIMRNGVPTYYEMSDPAALPAFKGYEAAHGAIVSVLATPANILRKAITLNPIFSLAQLPQDSLRAFVVGGLNNPYAIFPRVMKNFAKELFGGTDTGRELAKYGIVGKGSGMPTEASDNIRRQLGYYDKGAGGVWSRFTDGLEKISSASDEAVRTALYELTLEEGGSQVLALRRAREIINFDTQGAGATSSFLRQTVPFMGVWMNDLNNLYKGLVLGSARLSEGDKNATRAAIVYRGMQLAGLVTLYTLMVGDDDDYKKLDDDTRNRSLIVPGTGFRIPIPNDGIGFLFKVIPEEVTRAVMAQGIESDDAGAKMGRAIWNGFKNMGSFENLLPGAGSPLIKTPVELILNKSFYTGNPIVGKSKEFLAPAEQYTEGTSEIAKQLGAALNLSPIKLDYLVRGLTAQVGGSVLAASNSLFHAATGKVTPSWSGDIKDIPLLGQLGYSRKDKADLEDYYELRHTVDKVARTYRDMIASGRGKEAIEYLTDPTNRKAFALRQLQTQIDKGLAQYRNMEKLIYNNPNLDSDEMRRQLNRVEEMRTKYLQSLRLPKLRAFAEVSPPLDSSAFRILR